MPDAAELMKIIKKSTLEAVKASDPATILFGKVARTEPLEIDVEQKLKLREAQLILSRSVTEYVTEVTVDIDTDRALAEHSHNLFIEENEAGDPSHIHGISGSMETKDLGHTHKIKKRMKVIIHNGLADGDKVILIRNQGGQKYLVVDRIG